MKQILLCLTLGFGFALTANAQCPSNYTAIYTTCESLCVARILPQTGNLEIDTNHNLRQLTVSEAEFLRVVLQDRCTRPQEEVELMSAEDIDVFSDPSPDDIDNDGGDDLDP